LYAHTNSNPHCDSYTYTYTHAHHDADTERNGNSNCDCDDDAYCNTYFHSYAQTNAYTERSSDVAPASYPTAAAIGFLRVIADA
jgi:hypothetical protein